MDFGILIESVLTEFDEKQIIQAMNECSLEDIGRFFGDSSTDVHGITSQSISLESIQKMNKDMFKHHS